MLDTLEKVLPLGSVKREVPDLLKKMRQKTISIAFVFFEMTLPSSSSVELVSG